MTVRVKKIGGRLAFVVPKSIAVDFGLRQGEKLDLSRDGDVLVLRRSCRRGRRPIEELIAQIDPAAYARHDRELGDRPVGKEIW